VGVFAPTSLTNHESAFFMHLSYALRDRTDSMLNYKMPGLYCYLDGGKQKCGGEKPDLAMCVGEETIFSTDGNCTTWNANVDAKGTLLEGPGMYDSCIKDNFPTGADGLNVSTLPRLAPVGGGSRAAYTGRTQYGCTVQDRKGKTESYTECVDKPKEGSYVYVDSEFTAASTWNWVQSFPADTANCAADGACSTVCMKSPVSWMDAPSPALTENWREVTLEGEGKTAYLQNPRWSTWTESTWDADPTLESFLVSAPKADNAILGGGIGYFLFSFFAVWLVNKNVEIVDGESDYANE